MNESWFTAGTLLAAAAVTAMNSINILPVYFKTCGFCATVHALYVCKSMYVYLFYSLYVSVRM